MARRSSGGRVEIEGARMLRASLKAAGHGLEDLKIANRNAAKTVEKQAVATAPVSKRKGHVPGRLKPLCDPAVPPARASFARAKSCSVCEPHSLGLESARHQSAAVGIHRRTNH